MALRSSRMVAWAITVGVLDEGIRANPGDRRSHSRGDLAAAFRGREDLSRVKDLRGSKGCLESGHHLEIVRREDPAHIVALFVSHAVFPGDRSAGVYAQAHDFLAQIQDLFRGALHTLIEHHVRVEVAVAGVEHVRYTEAKTVTGLVNAVQHGWEPGARYDAVKDVIRGRQPSQRA